MTSKILIGFVFSLFVISGVFAADAEIRVKTIPFADVQASIIDDSSILDTLTKTSDGYGDVRFNFSIDDKTYSVIIFVKQNYQNVVEPEKFRDQDSGEPLYIEMLPKGVPPIETPNSTETRTIIQSQENITSNNDTIASKEAEKTNQSSLTGFAVFESGTFSTIAYILGGIIFIGFIVFMIVKLLKRDRSPKEVKVRKLSEINQEKQTGLQERMSDAERKLREAKEELEEIKKQKDQGNLKHQTEIEEAKKKLIEDERRLIELRSKKY